MNISLFASSLDVEIVLISTRSRDSIAFGQRLAEISIRFHCVIYFFLSQMYKPFTSTIKVNGEIKKSRKNHDKNDDRYRKRLCVDR